MIYSFYERLSVSNNNVDELRAGNIPPKGWPHGFGVRGEWATWFDNFLTGIMTNGASGTTNSNKGIRTYLSSHS